MQAFNRSVIPALNSSLRAYRAGSEEILVGTRDIAETQADKANNKMKKRVLAAGISFKALPIGP